MMHQDSESSTDSELLNFQDFHLDDIELISSQTSSILVDVMTSDDEDMSNYGST